MNDESNADLLAQHDENIASGIEDNGLRREILKRMEPCFINEHVENFDEDVELLLRQYEFKPTKQLQEEVLEKMAECTMQGHDIVQEEQAEILKRNINSGGSGTGEAQKIIKQLHKAVKPIIKLYKILRNK